MTHRCFHPGRRHPRRDRGADRGRSRGRPRPVDPQHPAVALAPDRRHARSLPRPQPRSSRSPTPTPGSPRSAAAPRCTTPASAWPPHGWHATVDPVPDPARPRPPRPTARRAPDPGRPARRYAAPADASALRHTDRRPVTGTPVDADRAARHHRGRRGRGRRAAPPAPRPGPRPGRRRRPRPAHRSRRRRLAGRTGLLDRRHPARRQRHPGRRHPRPAPPRPPCPAATSATTATCPSAPSTTRPPCSRCSTAATTSRSTGSAPARRCPPAGSPPPNSASPSCRSAPPIEVAATREAMRRLLASLGYPYLVLRLGRPTRRPAAPHTPRLPADQIIDRRLTARSRSAHEQRQSRKPPTGGTPTATHTTGVPDPPVPDTRQPCWPVVAGGGGPAGALTAATCCRRRRHRRCGGGSHPTAGPAGPGPARRGGVHPRHRDFTDAAVILFVIVVNTPSGSSRRSRPNGRSPPCPS